jgi:hypothetical protein
MELLKPYFHRMNAPLQKYLYQNKMMMVLQFIKYEFIKYVLEVKNEVGAIKRELYKKAR